MGQSDELRQVYVLIDPGDGTPRYVGISKDPRSRLALQMNEVENDKRARLAELKRMGFSSGLEVLETVVARRGVVVAVAIERERYGVRSLLRSGAPLTNIYGIPRSSSEPTQKRPSMIPRCRLKKQESRGINHRPVVYKSQSNGTNHYKEWTGAIQSSLLLLHAHVSFSVAIWDGLSCIEASVLKRYQAGVRREGTYMTKFEELRTNAGLIIIQLSI